VHKAFNQAGSHSYMLYQPMLDRLYDEMKEDGAQAKGFHKAVFILEGYRFDMSDSEALRLSLRAATSANEAEIERLDKLGQAQSGP